MADMMVTEKVGQLVCTKGCYLAVMTAVLKEFWLGLLAVALMAVQKADLKEYSMVGKTVGLLEISAAVL